jgi:hypothetical protein
MTDVGPLPQEHPVLLSRELAFGDFRDAYDSRPQSRYSPNGSSITPS